MQNIYASNIWKFYLLKFVSAIELTISVFVLYLLANNLSMTQVMLLETIFIAVVLALEVPSGAFADIYGRKTSIALSLLAVALAFVVFGLATDFWIFLVAQLLVALGWSLESGADSALIYDSLKEIKKERSYAKIFGKGNFIALFTWSGAALLSGFLAVYVGHRPLFFITAAIFLLGFFVALCFKEPPLHIKIAGKDYFRHLSEAIKFSCNHKIVRNLIIYYGMFAALGHLTWFLIQPFYGLGSIVGFAISLYFITAALGNLTAEHFIRKFKEEKLLISLLLVASLSFIGIFFVNRLFALALISLMSFACGVRDIFVSKGINEHTDSHHRATVISIQSMSKSLMYAVFAPLIGYFTDIFSVSAAFLMMGIALFLFFMYYLILSLIKRSAAL